MDNAPSARRRFLQCGALAVAAAALPGASRAGADTTTAILAEEYWAEKGPVKLYLYRKRLAGNEVRPVLFLVHGSSFSGRGGFDLQVPGHPGYSLMDAFARDGFDVWTVDHEGYGRSSRTGGNSDIASGAADLAASFPVVEQITKRKALMVYSQSSGAIRAGLFAMRQPDRVERLVLDAFTHTGEGAPEIMRRRQQADSYRANPSRPMTRASFHAIFSRDDPSTYEPAMAEALADYELALGNSAPSGTYLDMAVNLPLVDPARLTCPVLITRAEHDGNATEQELLDFFARLPNRDKQFAFMKGVAHVAVLGINRHRIIHVMRAFFTYPPTRDA